MLSAQLSSAHCSALILSTILFILLYGHEVPSPRPLFLLLDMAMLLYFVCASRQCFVLTRSADSFDSRLTHLTTAQKYRGNQTVTLSKSTLYSIDLYS